MDSAQVACWPRFDQMLIQVPIFGFATAFNNNVSYLLELLLLFQKIQDWSIKKEFSQLSLEILLFLS